MSAADKVARSGLPAANKLPQFVNIQREDLGEGWVGLLFDRPNSSANLFDEATFAELNDLCAELEKEPPKALVIRSAKPKIFIAGADLNSFTRDSSPENLSRVIRLGQTTFDRLAALPFPTVAAIQGVALGGGCEITLACDYRVGSLDKATKIGLPETMLGILPAWGGCTRLPRLIGLPAALEAILTGRQYTSKQALKLGLVDEVAYPERLIAAAQQVVREKSQKKRSISRQWLHFSPIASAVAAQARKTTLAKTRGHYPAPLKALEVAVAGVSVSHAQSLENERREFVALAQTPVAQNLIRVFFLQERARKLSVESPTPSLKIEKVLVVGAGVMGSGISQWLSSRGLSVLMQDIGPEPLAKGMSAITKLNQDAVRRRLLTESEANAVADRIVPVFGRVHYRQIDLLLEAAVEKLDLKQGLFKELEPRLPNTELFATNTSALSIDAIASNLQRPERLVGIHFFNPVHRMQLVEVVRGPRSSQVAVATAVNVVKSIGKLPILVNDSPGFLVNRILLPYMLEAVRAFAEGYSVEQIDTDILDFGMPMGPLRLIDEVGVDVSQHVGADLVQRVQGLPPATPILNQMIERGWLGKKSGKGFYVYSRTDERPNSELGPFQIASSPTVSDPLELRDRLILVMVNEAARCFEEGVVADAETVDFGMIMGTGWAPFRGGPLKFADELGLPTLVERLRVLSERHGSYLSPCQLLVQKAEKDETFFPPVSPKPAAAVPSP